MARINETVIRETKYIAAGVISLSVIMQLVFVILGAWDYTVLLGNLLSGGAAVFNFLWMGLSVQKAVEQDVKQARSIMRTSQALRTFFIFAVVAFGVGLKYFNTVAVIVPIFFPRVAIAARPLFGIDKSDRTTEVEESAEVAFEVAEKPDSKGDEQHI